MSPPIIGRPVPDEVWESIRAEFALPALEQVRRRLAELMEDPAPAMRQLVRIIDEGHLLPGFPVHPRRARCRTTWHRDTAADNAAWVLAQTTVPIGWGKG